ncbi:MAG: gamma-butyrobetaine hydroxylase-like domain-containing protein [Hyphomicrobiales bacterium]
MTAEPRPWPTEIRSRDSGATLVVTFDTAECFELSAEYLRVESPSAEVKGHGPGQEVTLGGKRNVKIISIEPVGNYAVKLTFDDMHSTGLYSWDYLAKLGRERDEIWAAYLEKLEAKGLTRG